MYLKSTRFLAKKYGRFFECLGLLLVLSQKVCLRLGTISHIYGPDLHFETRLLPSKNALIVIAFRHKPAERI